MTLTPNDLLKKLKPTASFAVTADDLSTLAQLAIQLGPEAFAEHWKALFAPTRKASTKRKSPNKSAATEALQSFAASRGLKSAEIATAFIRWVVSGRELPPPTKAAMSSVVSASTWLTAKLGDASAGELAAQFVEKFSSETDYTYR